MGAYREFSEDEAAAAAQAALARAFGAPAILSGVARLGDERRRNLVLRAQAAIGGERRSIIVKATRAADYAPASPDAFAASGLVKEWVARELLAQAETGGPTSFLAGDAARGLIVFADLGSDLNSLVAPLLGGAAAEAEAALTAYAVALGRLHAATIGCAQRHAAILNATFPAARVPPPMGADWLASLPELDGRGLPEDELDVARARLREPGPWLALVHGDGCPDNVLIADGEARLLDFEFAAPGHMLLDAVYWRLGFPTCWCAGTTPDDVADRIEAGYRRALAPALPQAADDRAFRAEMAIASLARLAFSLNWLLQDALTADREWGVATCRGRILWYLQAAHAACARGDLFAGSRAVMARWLAYLRELWPDSEPLGAYPAFAGADRSPLQQNLTRPPPSSGGGEAWEGL